MVAQAPRQNSLAPLTLLLVLSAESAFFATLVMSYLFLRAGGSSAPVLHFTSFDLLIASLNTGVLLVSTAFAWRSTHHIQQERVGRLQQSLAITLALGALFVAGQVLEFKQSGLQIDDTIFSSAFFALITFHALHVIAGMAILAINLVRARLGDFTARRHTAITAGAWFWYFVAAVWVVLFAVLYLV